MIHNSSKITQEYLQEKRHKTDPIADNVIEEIISSGNEELVNSVFLKLVSNNSYKPEMFNDLPETVCNTISNYFSSTSALPKWAKQNLIDEGQLVFALYGPEIAMLLNVKSLPLCYACGNGAKVLYMTGRLSDHNGDIDPLVRRLMETAQMVMNTMSPGGLSPTGNGIVTIQKVRLIHASIRYFLKNKKYNRQGWDSGCYGEPINQEDMAGTLMSFSALIVDGLIEIGIELSEEQKQGYMHCWKVIGYLMGLDEDLLPNTYEDGWKLGVSIMSHQAEETMEGKELTNSCIKFLQEITPGTLFDGIPEYMVWFFSQDISKATGKDLAICIGAEERAGIMGKVSLLLTKLVVSKIDQMDNHSKLIQVLSSKFNRVLLQGFLKHYNGGKNIHFFIPPSLKKDWGLDNN